MSELPVNLNKVGYRKMVGAIFQKFSQNLVETMQQMLKRKTNETIVINFANVHKYQRTKNVKVTLTLTKL